MDKRPTKIWTLERSPSRRRSSPLETSLCWESFSSPNLDLNALKPLGDGIWLRLSREPWWKQPTLPSGEGLVFTLPYQGWDAEVWCDGPLMISRGERVMALLAPGTPGILRWQGEEAAPSCSWDEAKAFLVRERGITLRQSLSLALQTRVGLAPERVYELSVRAWDASSAALLILLRASYPQTFFQLSGSPPTPPWKRLCQNLNVDLREAESGLRLELESLWPAGEQWIEFLNALQKQVPVLPESLLRSFILPG